MPVQRRRHGPVGAPRAAVTKRGGCETPRRAATLGRCGRTPPVPARAASRPDRQEALMKRWTKPRIVTLCTGMEINSYATAE